MSIIIISDIMYRLEDDMVCT